MFNHGKDGEGEGEAGTLPQKNLKVETEVGGEGGDRGDVPDALTSASYTPHWLQNGHNGPPNPNR